MSSNPSLRDLYNPPSSPWSFANPSYQWNAGPASSSVFDLAPVIEPPSANMSLLFRSLVASALLQYSSTGIAMPLEVGKLLLQIQWVPRDTVVTRPESEEQIEEEEYVGIHSYSMPRLSMLLA